MVSLRRASLVLLLAAPLACAVAEGGTHDEDDPPPRAAPSHEPSRGDSPEDSTVASLPPASSSDALATSRPQTPDCPAGMARLQGFCIDRYEAHLVTRGQDGALTRHPHYERPEEGVIYEARSEPGVFPQAYISRVESQSACENAGKRLCTMREWQRACKGTSNTTYPYGPHRQAGRCNTEKPHLLTLRFGADSRRWAYAQFNDPALDREPGFLAKTGDYAGCASDMGVQDLVGNLHEWVSDTADAAFKARLDSDGIHRTFQYWAPRNGVFMGGFYSTQGELGPGCTFTTLAHEPTYHDYSTGFRCCADPS